MIQTIQLRNGLITLFVLLFLPFSALKAQYTSPGDNLTLSLSDLVELSDGAVIQDEDGFIINDDIIIALTDVLEITDEALVRVAQGVRLEFQGNFISDPVSGHVTFTAADTTSSSENFRGFRFEDSEQVVFRNTTVKYGGGIQLIGAQAEFDQCIIRNNGTSNVTGGSITYSNTSPIINECLFLENTAPAVGSGANVFGSPQITNNTIISNTMNNQNRPQLNLGPGVAGDTLRIENNYIEGFNDNAGGIAISNLFGAGTNILVVVRNNVVVNNRYGYTQIGNQINSFIEDNVFEDNNIQGNPNLGGSGLNFVAANQTSSSTIRRNVISGNLWGITTQMGDSGSGDATLLNLGTEDDPGGNVFFGNENGGVTYAFFNNTPVEHNAIGNYWGDNTAEFAESVIFHQPDNSSYGLVTYEPINTLHPEFEVFLFLAENNPSLDEDLEGDFDSESGEIRFEVAPGTDISSLLPAAEVALGVTSDTELEAVQNFTNPVVYTLSVPHGDEQEWTVIVEVAEEEPALVQIIHNAADPAAEFVDVFVNDEAFLEDFAYGTATPFVEVPSGVELNIEIRAAGTETAVFDDTYVLEARLNYIINAVGVADPGAFAPNPDGNDTGLDLVVLAEARAESVSEDNFDFVVLHAVTDAPAVDVRAGELLLVDGAAYGDITEYLSVAADVYVLDILPAGTDTPLVAYSADLSPFAGQSAVIAARGFLNPAANQDGPGFELVVVLASGEVITLQEPVSTEPGIDGPVEFALNQNYPNPFNPTTNISFTLPEAGDVSLEVFNVQGQRVATLVNGSRSAGAHTVTFDATHLASGIYLYRLQSGSKVQTMKMMLVK